MLFLITCAPMENTTGRPFFRAAATRSTSSSKPSSVHSGTGSTPGRNIDSIVTRFVRSCAS